MRAEAVGLRRSGEQGGGGTSHYSARFVLGVGNRRRRRRTRRGLWVATYAAAVDEKGMRRRGHRWRMRRRLHVVLGHRLKVKRGRRCERRLAIHRHIGRRHILAGLARDMQSEESGVLAHRSCRRYGGNVGRCRFRGMLLGRRLGRRLWLWRLPRVMSHVQGPRGSHVGRHKVRGIGQRHGWHFERRICVLDGARLSGRRRLGFALARRPRRCLGRRGRRASSASIVASGAPSMLLSFLTITLKQKHLLQIAWLMLHIGGGARYNDALHGTRSLRARARQCAARCGKRRTSENPSCPCSRSAFLQMQALQRRECA